jgi:hypothetical protein
VPNFVLKGRFADLVKLDLQALEQEMGFDAHVPSPWKPRGAMRRRQRQTVYVHLSRLDLPHDGALEYIPGEAEAYYGALDKPSHGLIEARVGTYAGIVFATWAEDAPSLEPISATLAGISTRHSIAGTAECRRWAR